MQLVIDIGNSQTKTALFKQKQLFSTQVFDGISSNDLLQYIKKSNYEKAIVSSVKKLSDELHTFLQNENILLLTGSTKIPLQMNYATPHTLGVDRIAAAVGAQAIFSKTNVLCFDLGTCITSEFITANGVYHGGSISPGMLMRFKAMHTFTDKLPLVNPKPINPLNVATFATGNSTELCMQAGVVYGIAFEIKGIIDFYAAQHKDLKVLFTGGDAHYFESLLNMKIFVQPQLVLMGLNEILLHNAI